MDQELHERFAHKLGRFAGRRNHVEHAVDREQYRGTDDDGNLLHGRFAPEAGHTFVPHGRQQLLNVRMGHKLLLLVVDRKLQPGQLHVIAIHVGRRFRIVVQNDGQLLRAAGLVQQLHREILTLVAQLQILRFALLLGKGQIAQLPGQLERRQQRILRAERNQ